MTSPIPVAMAGAGGRMGRAAIRALAPETDIRIVASWEAPGHEALGRDAGETAGIAPAGVVIATRPDHPGTPAPRVVVDFTRHDAAVATARWAADRGIGMVIGTTGFTPDELGALRDLSARVPVLAAPNLSVGVNILFRVAARVAAALGPGYDAEIVEMHHRHKRDAPSGTALRLAESMLEATGGSLERDLRHGRSGDVGERPVGELGMHAVRAGEIVGDHMVLFAGPGERIELVHRALSREAFASGVAPAIRTIAAAAPGWYSMDNVLGL